MLEPELVLTFEPALGLCLLFALDELVFNMSFFGYLSPVTFLQLSFFDMALA